MSEPTELRSVEVTLPPEPGPGGIVTDSRGLAWQNIAPAKNDYGMQDRAIARHQFDAGQTVVTEWVPLWVPCIPREPDRGMPQEMTWPVLAATHGPLTVHYEGGNPVQRW